MNDVERISEERVREWQDLVTSAITTSGKGVTEIAGEAGVQFQALKDLQRGLTPRFPLLTFFKIISTLGISWEDALNTLGILDDYQPEIPPRLKILVSQVMKLDEQDREQYLEVMERFLSTYGKK